MEDKQQIAIISVISNSFLTLIKLVSGVLTGSVSLLSEALHSFGDLLASLIAWGSIKESSKPADKEHQFGHGKFEDMAGFIEAILIIVTALFILYVGFEKLITKNSEFTFQADIAVYIMIFSVAVPIVRAEKIVFRARSAHCGKLCVAVHIEFEFAFAPPTAFSVKTDIHCGADVVSFSVYAVKNCMYAAINRAALSVLSMKVSAIFRYFTDFIVNLIVNCLSFVGKISQSKPKAFTKWHLPEAAETSAWSNHNRLRRNNRKSTVAVFYAVGEQREKCRKRDFYRWFLAFNPKNSQNAFFGNLSCHPNAFYHSGSRNVGKYKFFSRLNIYAG